MKPASGRGLGGRHAAEAVMTCGVPDAVAALVQGVLDDNPEAERAAYGRLIVGALRRDGWLVVAPTGRSRTEAVDGPSNSPPGARSKGNAHRAA